MAYIVVILCISAINIYVVVIERWPKGQITSQLVAVQSIRERERQTDRSREDGGKKSDWESETNRQTVGGWRKKRERERERRERERDLNILCVTAEH